MIQNIYHMIRILSIIDQPYSTRIHSSVAAAALRQGGTRLPQQISEVKLSHVQQLQLLSEAL